MREYPALYFQWPMTHEEALAIVAEAKRTKNTRFYMNEFILDKAMEVINGTAIHRP